METFKKWAPVILVLGAMAVIGVIAVVNSLRCDLLVDASDEDLQVEVDGVAVGQVAKNEVGRFEVSRGPHHVRALAGTRSRSELDLDAQAGACWLWRVGEGRPLAIFHQTYGAAAPPAPEPEPLEGNVIDLAKRGLGCSVDGSFPRTQEVRPGEEPIVIRRVCHANADGSRACTVE